MSVLLAIYRISDVPDGPQTGDIVRRVTCSESVADQQCRDGEAYIELPRGTIFSDATHYINVFGDVPVLSLKGT